jgi:hypothetical protein
MHHWTGKHPPLYENVDSRKTVELASSRDLRNWKRVADRAAFMELSPVGDGGAYDTGQIGTTNGVVRRNNELWFYYTAMKFRSQTIAETLNHGYLDASALAIARLRLDGFVSLKGGIEWGSVLTKPVQIDGSELRVNANSWRGRVKAELLDPDEKKPLPGYGVEECIPVMVDHIDEPMRWQGKADLCELQGKSVRIRFSLWQSELYAYWFAGSK